MPTLPLAENETAIKLIGLIQRLRLDLSSEKRLQSDMETELKAAGYDFTREKRLSGSDIPDFLVHDGVVIECKVRGARKMDTYHQLCRYAEHDEVKALILASNLSMSLPADINGKPAYMASLSRAYL